MEEFPKIYLENGKREMIKNCIFPISVYLSTEDSQVINGFRYYIIEVGVLNNNLVKVHLVKLRYSQLEKMNRSIKQLHILKIFYNQLEIKFPPKRYFGKEKESVIYSRIKGLKDFLSKMTRFHHLSERKDFQEMFNIFN
jgi:hypothetical protein